MRLLRPVLFVPFVILSACAVEAPAEHVSSTGQAIVGGATSTTAQDAAVMILANGRFSCTGTLITPNLVLTARHCVAADLDETSPCGPAKGDMQAAAFSIALGVNADETKKVARGTKLFVPATTSLCGSDIALIQLDVDVPNGKVAKVRFEKLAVGETTFAVGYGAATPDGPPSSTRRQRQTTVQAVGPASPSFQARSGETIPYQVPAGDVSTGESTCLGDSGGPLFDEGGSVVGVTSRGIDGECVDRPAVYASVAAHTKLINDAATAAGHPLAELAGDGDPAKDGEGDPGDEGTGDDKGTSAARRKYEPQPNAGCTTAPIRGPRGVTAFLLGLALVAASFRRRSQTK
jgi:secreted trypsin-like serine protease